MEFENLERELREKLPPATINVNVETGLASYYDYYGVTFRDEDSEQRYANSYVARIISEKAGFPIRVTREVDGNGHCAVYFQRLAKE